MIDQSSLGVAGFAGTRAYSIDSSDFSLMSTVRHLLTQRSYRELFTVDNHLVLLESLRRKLSVISAAEANAGLMNWHLRERITELDALMKGLRDVRHRLFERLA